MRGFTKWSALAITAVAVLVFAAPASAAQYTVDNDRLECPLAEFTSIQAAVTAASAGDRIKVCAGTYPEQVDVTPDKTNLKLWSSPRQAAVIQAPLTIAASMHKAIVRIGATGVGLERFTITGPGPGPCDSIRWGVRVDRNGSADIRENRITMIRDTPFSGCQNGIAVLVGRNSENQVGRATLFANHIDHYQKGGVVVDGPGSFAAVQQNRVEGSGSTPVLAQNGIQVSRSADADVLENIVVDHTYAAPLVASATGILPFQTSGMLVKRNHAQRNDDNLAAFDTENSVIEQNDFVRSTFYDGIYMGSDTAGNVIRGNFLRENAEHDCHDDSANANVWTQNDGVTQNRPGLCNPNGGVKPGRQEEPNRRIEPFE